MSSEFYVTLASNAHSESKIGDFRTKLANVLVFPVSYEVALTSIIYPATHDIITHSVESDNFHENEVKMSIFGEQHSFSIPPCSFSNGEDLVGIVNYQFLKNYLVWNNGKGSKDALIHYNKYTNRCSIAKIEGISQIKFSQRIAYFLGIDCELEHFPYFGKYSINHGSDFMFIYVNGLVEPQILSNSKVPLIKVISLPPGHGENVEISFNRPTYVPVQVREVENIWIQIKNDRNELIPFNSGKILMVLHFRPTRSQLY